MLYGNNTNTRETVGMFSQKVEPAFTNTMRELREAFVGTHGIDPIKEIDKILSHRSLAEQYEQILFEDYQNSALSENAGAYSNAIHNSNIAMFNQLKENSKQQLLESAGYSQLNPVVGLTLPLLKRYWIENVFKDIVPTEVPLKPVFKLGIERKWIMDSTGKKHLLPEALESNPELLIGAVRKPLLATKIDVPNMNFDLLGESGGSLAQRDAISSNFFIKSIYLEVKGGTTGAPTTPEVEVANLRIPVDMATGQFSYTVSANGTDDFVTDVTTDVLLGTLNFESGALNLGSINGKVTGVKVVGTLSNENNMTSASTGWEHEMKEFTIPDGIHLNTGLTAERMMDSKMLYNVDEASYNVKIMADSLAYIREIDGFKFLNDSKERLTGTKFLQTATFDCKPPSNIVIHDPYEYIRNGLKNTLENMASKLKQVFKNKNMRFVVYGNVYDIRLLDKDINWTYTTETPMGGVKLDYNMGIVNNMHNFSVISSEHCPAGKIRLLLIPTTEEQMTYKHFEFSMIIANDYRDPNMPNVPSIMSSLRYLDTEVMPIQGEINVINNALSASDLFFTE